MSKILNFYKPVGRTPLEVVKAAQKLIPILKENKITYVGRLDPLACGVQLLLTSPRQESIDHLKGLNKEYVFKILLGVETDTYDPLGLIIKVNPSQSIVSQSTFSNLLPNFIKKYQQPYPPFSAVRVAGKPLHHWAKHNLLENVTIPKHMISIFSLDLQNWEFLSGTKVFNQVKSLIALVKGDFRQSEIRQSWNQSASILKQGKFIVATIRISCSSGTYVRQLCHEIGFLLGTGAIALEITRTKVGQHELNDSLKIASDYYDKD